MDKTNPKHYRDAAITLEPIDLCELLGFNLGNAVKYIVRAGADGNAPPPCGGGAQFLPGKSLGEFPGNLLVIEHWFWYNGGKAAERRGTDAEV